MKSICFVQTAGNIFVWHILDETKTKALRGSPQSAFANGKVIYDIQTLVKKKFYMEIYRINIS